MHVMGWMSRWTKQLSRFKRSNSLLLALVVLLAIIALIDSTWHALVDGIGTYSIDTALILALICVFGALANHIRKRDIERHRGEREAVALQASRKLMQYETALNTMHQGVVLVDGDERIVVCNDAYLKIYGHSSDIIGCYLIDVLHQRAALGNFNRDPEEYRRETIAKLASGENTSWLNKTQDGRYILIQNTPMAGGGWLSTHDDVTEKHRYEEELTASRAQALAAERNAKAAHDHLKEAFEVVPEALVMFDADDRIVLWNKRYKDIHVDYPDLIKVGSKFEDLLRLGLKDNRYPDAVGREEEWLAERLARHKLSHSVAEYRIRDRWLRIEERRTADGGSLGIRVDITDLKNSEESFRLLFDSNPLPMFLHDIDSKAILSANDSMVRHYGYEREQLLRMTIRDLRHPDDRDKLFHDFVKANGAIGGSRATRHRKSDGSDIDVVYYSRQLKYEGRQVGLTAIVDITEQQRATEELNATRELLHTVIEAVPSAILVRDAADSRYVLMNKAGAKLFDRSRDQIIGKTPLEVFGPGAAERIRDNDLALLAQGDDIAYYDTRPAYTTPDDPRVVNSRRLIIRGPDNEPKLFMAVAEDVTEQKQAKERIAYLAHHDVLTGLANRGAFEEHFSATLLAAAGANQPVGVMCMDLDRFKEVNDMFGHSVGDALLREVAQRVCDVASGAFIARLGGDEFTVVVANEDADQAAMRTLAESLIAAVARPFNIDGRSIRVGLTIGIARSPDDGTDAQMLMSNADAALYRAKAEGRGGVRFFDTEMDRRKRERRALQRDLQVAIERGEFELHYQPQAEITGKLIAFEALLRWRHPTRGFVSPADFIPIAEESGLIVPIGEWVMREACREAARWPHPLRIAINLSPVQFLRGNLPELVLSVLLDTGLSPSRLELEITEGVLIGDFARAKSVLGRLKGLGVSIAMDDFGTGYSSLSYMQSFPFDRIKIDRGFIAGVDGNAQCAAIVRAAIGLGHGLNLPVIAEGVETESQMEFLRREKCDEVQGHFIGKPRPIAEYADFLANPQDVRPIAMPENAQPRRRA
jgi:diguanylate cyclase (GGDEF)-like protein/PAS domain S-box-containing protein